MNESGQIHILLVEDTPEVQHVVKKALQSLAVTVAGTLHDAHRALAEHSFDLILLDVMLPDGNGFEFFAELKHSVAQHLPVIFLTSQSELSQKTLGFSLGAEDYVTKPFDPGELRLRVMSRISKTRNQKIAETKLEKGNLSVSLTSRKAYLTNSDQRMAIDFTPHEFSLLVLFMKNIDRVLTRQQLIDEVWGANVHIVDRTVDTHVANLRKKIKASGLNITAVYGEGYRAEVEADGAQTKKRAA